MMPKITFAVFLALVVAELILTRQVSPLVLVPFVFSFAQAFFSSGDFRRPLAERQMGASIGTASIYLADFG